MGAKAVGRLARKVSHQTGAVGRYVSPRLCVGRPCSVSPPSSSSSQSSSSSATLSAATCAASPRRQARPPWRPARHLPRPSRWASSPPLSCALTTAVTPPSRCCWCVACSSTQPSFLRSSQARAQACLGDIFDVSIGADFYGPGGPYGCFAGRSALASHTLLPVADACRSEANRALAKMSLKAEDCVPDVEGLSLMETDILRDWKTKFETKYTKVGTVKTD